MALYAKREALDNNSAVRRACLNGKDEILIWDFSFTLIWNNLAWWQILLFDKSNENVNWFVWGIMGQHNFLVESCHDMS